MGAPAKFLFDVDFAAPRSNGPRAATSAEIAQQVADAEARGYQRGFDAAQREARLHAELRTAQALSDIGQAISAIAQGLGGVEARMETEAVDVAVAVARKLCSELIRTEPLAEMTALVRDCFHHLVATPHIVVRINDQLYDAAREKIERLAATSGFVGRVIILAEPDIVGGDCKIEWADGGVALERGAIEARITLLVESYMASRGAVATSGQNHV